MGMICDYFMAQGKTGLARYQLNGVIRQYLGGQLDLAHEDLDALERLIRAKETGVSGSNSKAVADRVRFKNAMISGQGTPKLSNYGSQRVNVRGSMPSMENINNRNLVAAVTLEQAMRGNP